MVVTRTWGQEKCGDTGQEYKLPITVKMKDEEMRSRPYDGLLVPHRCAHQHHL